MGQKAPIEDEMVDVCSQCNEYICEHVIAHMRRMEDAMFTAKQAIETLDALNKKQAAEIQKLYDEIDELKEQKKIVTRENIKEQMEKIDKQHQRFENRGKLVDNRILSNMRQKARKRQGLFRGNSSL